MEELDSPILEELMTLAGKIKDSMNRAQDMMDSTSEISGAIQYLEKQFGFADDWVKEGKRQLAIFKRMVTEQPPTLFQEPK